jgi:hypothetical protein
MRFEVISGSCTLNADSTCFMSPDYPYNYPNDASCTIGITSAANGAGYLGVRSFSTEGDYDFLRVGANTYSGLYGPVGAGPLTPGSLLTFSSDGSVTRQGATPSSENASPDLPATFFAAHTQPRGCRLSHLR